MKNIYNILCISIVLFFSCSKDEGINNVVNNEPEPDIIITATETCFYDDLTIEPNTAIKINCLLDLKGQTINVPEGVTLEFDGGDIFNGTLNFSSNGKIAGELLNSNLAVAGDVTLISDKFEFIASRWNVIEGEVSSEIAESNKENINELLQFIITIKSSTILTFIIDEFDAYFKVDGYDQWGNALVNLGVKIPSNFNVILSDKTYFRMYPNSNKSPSLVFLGYGVENITITGGHFVGDRDEHDYTTVESTHEWGHLINISGGINITITKAEFIDATGDGINVYSYGHSFDQHHIATKNVFIKENTFIRNRRNQISITSGSEVYIENNDFIDCSIHTDLSNGIAPGFAIDVEAFHSNGIKYQIAEDIYIRNNTESGSRVGAFTIHTGDRVSIENNVVEGFISYSNTTGSKINNNSIRAISESQKSGGIGILAGRTDRYDLNFNNEIKGNVIEDYGSGIVVTNVDVIVAENEIRNCVRGIVLEEIKDAEFFDNKIYSTNSSSTGYSSGAAATFIDNITISQTNPDENLIQVSREPFKFVFINQDLGFEDYSFTIKDNNVSSSGTSTLSSNGIVFTNNIISEGGLRLASGERIVVTNNTITSTVANAIRIDGGCNDITITDNILSSVFSCVKDNNTNGANIVINNNTCN